MGPPFVLEALRPSASTPRNPKVMVAKNSYCDKVKTEDWQYRYKGLPPLPQEDLAPVKPCKQETPPKSECICDGYKSTYKLMTDQLDTKNHYVNPLPHRELFNYFVYRDEMINTDMFNVRRTFPTILKNDSNIVPEYMTTMQMSYSQPLGLVMHRLRAPEERFMLYRRMKGIDDPTMNTKFIDDRDKIINKQYKCAKGGRGVSFNFMTGLNTDGSLPKELTMRENMAVMKKHRLQAQQS